MDSEPENNGLRATLGETGGTHVWDAIPDFSKWSCVSKFAESQHPIDETSFLEGTKELD
jgi:hypothetical protein